MLRLGGVVGILVAALGTPVLATNGVPLLVSGSPYSAIVDTNKNGQLGDDGDCTFMSFMTGDTGLEVRAMQPVTATNQLRACTGPCFGNGFLSSDFGEVSIASCDWRRSPRYPWVPAVLEFGPTVPSSSSPMATGGAQGVINQPVQVQAGRLRYPAMLDGEPPGFGSLCDAGGPAAQVALMGGMMVVRDIKQVQPNGQAFACVNMPFELEAGGFDFFDACVPTTPGGNIEVSQGDMSPLAVARLVGLPSCGTTAAPAATGLGLILLAVALLGTGAWALGRRRSFVASLPLL